MGCGGGMCAWTSVGGCSCSSFPASLVSLPSTSPAFITVVLVYPAVCVDSVEEDLHGA